MNIDVTAVTSAIHRILTRSCAVPLVNAAQRRQQPDIFTKRRVGYWIEKYETRGQGSRSD